MAEHFIEDKLKHINHRITVNYWNGIYSHESTKWRC